MKNVDAPHVTPSGNVAFWYDPRKRSILYQLGVLAMVGLLGYYLITNTQANLERQSIATGFGFLEKEAGFEIGESVICVEDEDTIGSKPLNDFSLRMRNAFEAAKPLEMRAARVIEYRDIGAHQIGEIGDFTSMISAHFDNREGLFTETTKG